MIKKIYSNIIISKNEDNIDELTFKDKEICEEYINIISKLWPEWISDKDKTVMQFIADICKSMNIAGYLSIDNLYELSEKEVIEKILNAPDEYISNSFKKFLKTDKVYSSENPIIDKYCVHIKSKERYIIPLVQTQNKSIRIDKISKPSKKKIEEYLNSQKVTYTYFNFDFKPYNEDKQKILKKHPL